ncbi:MAG: DUF3823 domain-containing protein [Chitinophagaceae bacterium]|nr:MAG: DUF3823 domain-containing protein [Chitinophagaceae bacterium]
MKNNIFYLLTILCTVVISCTKDNKDAPGATIKGTVKYGDVPVGVRSNGVQLELWQYGYQLFSKIPVHINQDGTFSAAVFDGKYKLTMLRGNGPWADKVDSMDVSVNGSTNIDVVVEPYFVIRNPAFQKIGNQVNATFTLQRINTTRPLELVRIYIGQTVITDQNNNAANAQKLAAAVPDLSQPVTLSATIPASLLNKKNVFVRIGVKAVGVGELFYSPSSELVIN